MTETDPRLSTSVIAKKITPKRLEEWFRTYNTRTDKDLTIEGPVAPNGTSLGWIAYKDGTFAEQTSNKIAVVLRRDKSEPSGYYVYTAYPLP